MTPPLEPSAVRRGRFLWMDKTSREKYLADLTRRIANGHFFSDAILTRVVDELAPVLSDAVDGD